jgi:hypothetical protein
MPNQHRCTFRASLVAGVLACLPALGQTDNSEQQRSDPSKVARECIISLDNAAGRLAVLARDPGGLWRAIVQNAVNGRLSFPVGKECSVTATLVAANGEGAVVLSGKTKDPRQTIDAAQTKLADLGLKVSGEALEQSSCEPPQEYVFGNGFKFPVNEGRPRVVRAREISRSLYSELPRACAAAAAEAARLFPEGDWRPWVIDPGLGGQGEELKICEKRGDDWIRSGDIAHVYDGLIVLRHTKD